MFDPALESFLNDRVTNFDEINHGAGRESIVKGKTLENLAGIAIGLMSPERIRKLSHGKVLISETINYRTQKPERGGLFCEQIFGPRKNYECACGKYKRIRYKGVVCDKCGVEVTKASVRRDRMGHIDLYAPVAHIWFVKSVPSRIGLFLDIPVKKLEQIIYFASYIVTDVDNELKDEALKTLEEKYKVSKTEKQKELQKELNDLRIQREGGELTEKKFKTAEAVLMKSLDDMTEEFEDLRGKLKTLESGLVLGELEYRVLAEKFAHVFKGGTGAEHLKTLLERIDLTKFIEEAQKELKTSTATKQKKILQKIKIASNLIKSGQRPEWFIMDALPILPPDLRPMIQLDGGRFASSDLNDLYRRVINRNNRLKKFLELGAPEVILKNEKRMLQESVDMLLTGETRTNRSGYVTATKKKQKSLTEVLKGKQGRFRQNLLGKRVDFSARSVIVVGPNLKMDECGLPKKMALTLFKPFIIGKLVEKGIVYTVKHAEKFIEKGDKLVWDILDEVIAGKYVLLNRAPTLHRLSIQAFKPVLVEGKAIQLHPLTCSAFNADFDGDQMAVHLPLTDAAQKEARELMVTSKNLLSPSSGEPIVSPSQDMIVGCYYMSTVDTDALGTGRYFAGLEDLGNAVQDGNVGMRALVKVRIDGEIVETTYGRMLFNLIVPEEIPFVNEVLKKGNLKKLLLKSFEELGHSTTSKFVNDIKNFGYKYATLSGISISKDDMIIPSSKKGILEKATDDVRIIQTKHWHGFLTEEEKYLQSISIWSEAKKVIETDMKKNYDYKNHIFNLVDSGARGSWGNITQLSGMKGLVAGTTGDIIEVPIKSTLKEGFTSLEYFSATHGGRKGKSDTAIKTAQGGYLTRRLVDSAQNILVKEEDCKTIHYKNVNRNEKKGGFDDSFEDKIYSNTLARDVLSSDGKILIEAGKVIDTKTLNLLNENKIDEVSIRSVLTCESEGGVCQKCYGLDLGTNHGVEIGTPIGIIAAQSIGEPGTQLTMRTFHSGGVAKEGGDMAQGLARVEELFEARTPKYVSEISDINGNVEIKTEGNSTTIKITADRLEEEEYYYGNDYEVLVKVGAEVKPRQVLAKSKLSKQKIVASYAGAVKKISAGVITVSDTIPRIFEYDFDIGRTLLVKNGDGVKKGQRIVEGNSDISRIMKVSGVLSAEEYIVSDIKSIYSSQGQTVNSKHIELIVRQMFSRVRILDKGDSAFFPGDIVDIIRFKKENDKLIRDSKIGPIAERLLLGITKISLFTDSWLSAASFQETVRVLVESATAGKIDKLQELKENVIIGRKIPAGLEYRKKHGLVEDFEQDEFFDVEGDEGPVDLSGKYMQDLEMMGSYQD